MKTSYENYGVLDEKYAEGRQQNKALKYRLWRRTYEVKAAINNHLEARPSSIIDLGTADGLMLKDLQIEHPNSHCTGVEFNYDLVQIAQKTNPHLNIIQGDVQDLSSFSDNTFDVAVATAIIEHLTDPNLFVAEVHRVLRPNGILILTAPDPFWERIATAVGHLQDEQHNEVPNIKKMSKFCTDHNLKIVETKKFMLSPVGMPAEFFVEKILRMFLVNFLMANQLVVARKMT